jgi:hypothetical protein
VSLPDVPKAGVFQIAFPKTPNWRQSSIAERHTERPKDDAERSKLVYLKVWEIEAVEEHSVADKLMEPLAKTKPEPRCRKTTGRFKTGH